VADYNHDTAYTEQYLFNIQRQFGTAWALEVGYLGSTSHHLYGFLNANMGIPGVGGNSTSRYPFPNWGVIQLVNDGANAIYNSATFKVTKRFTNGFNIISSYTFAKSIDETSGIRVQGYDTLFPQNSYCLQCERAPSSFDTRHRLIFSSLYDLPIGKGKLVNINNRFLNAVIGGWETGGTLTLQSGVPVNLTIGGVDNSGTANGYDRPNYVYGVNPYMANETPSKWYNPDAFVEAPQGSFGNVGRNFMTAPKTFTIDAQVHKEFHMPYKENHLLQFRVEAFNVLNHPNWGEPNANILSGAQTPGQSALYPHLGFGVITSTAIAMRQVQLGLKYQF
jgi:hypothetical protein